MLVEIIINLRANLPKKPIRTIMMLGLSAGISACGGGGGGGGGHDTPAVESPKVPSVHFLDYRFGNSRSELEYKNFQNAIARADFIKPLLSSIGVDDEHIAEIVRLGVTGESKLSNGGTARVISKKLAEFDPKFGENTEVVDGEKLLQAIRKLIAPIAALKVNCGVRRYVFQYKTKGSLGEPAVAAAELTIPYGDKPECQGARPIVLGAHGASDKDAFDDKWNSAEGQYDLSTPDLMQLFAVQGFVTIEPYLIGYAGSDIPYEGFFQKEQNGEEMRDALLAGRELLARLSEASKETVSDSGQLFVTGGSQGGYVAASAVRKLQKSGEAVTASAPLAGPLAISVMIDKALIGVGSPALKAYFSRIAQSWDKLYGDLYTLPSIYPGNDPRNIYSDDNGVLKIVKDQETAWVNNAFGVIGDPDAVAFAEKYLKGLPLIGADSWQGGGSSDGRFYNVVPSEFLDANPAIGDRAMPGFGGETPILNAEYAQMSFDDATSERCVGNEAWLDRADNVGTGAENPVRLAHYADISDPFANCSPQAPLRRAGIKNDLRDFVPQSPMLLCGSYDDRVVDFEASVAAAGYFIANGAAPEDIKVMDLTAHADFLPTTQDPMEKYDDIFKYGSALEALKVEFGKAYGEEEMGSVLGYAAHTTSILYCAMAAGRFFDGYVIDN